MLRLASSDLTGNEKSALLVILLNTRGASGRKWRVYGRDAAEVSAQTVADQTGMTKRTAHTFSLAP